MSYMPEKAPMSSHNLTTGKLIDANLIATHAYQVLPAQKPHCVFARSAVVSQWSWEGEGSVAKPLIIAHRGASQQAPENTLPAIEKALEAGVDMLALEVQKTKDDQPVVLADVSLDRTTNGTGRVARMTADEVRSLDAGSWFNPAYAGVKVPTLAEGVAAVADKARLMLSLPETRSGTPWAQRLAETLQARQRPAEDVLVFNDSESLKSFRELAPAFTYALALGEKVDGWLYLEKAGRMGLKAVRPHRAQIDSVLVRQAHAKNIQVFAYFANEETDLRELLDLRVDGIVTGRPERMRKLLQEA